MGLESRGRSAAAASLDEICVQVRASFFSSRRLKLKVLMQGFEIRISLVSGAPLKKNGGTRMVVVAVLVDVACVLVFATPGNCNQIQ